ncbi:OmpH family outer membrane protein [Pseudorhodobacter wandonensis]|jgi:Skp family chaperone for outer membrane proteins|uniref:OmpH family outer membrane protein n=1 Tax=Pseudorhodobacter wandonensis TaxID=1120568 RepID=UPI00067C555E|nr:OmpH family outer membrane protein [Pseudorhodobacter wandonensis]
MRKRLAAASLMAFAAIGGPQLVLAQGAALPAADAAPQVQIIQSPVLTINQQRFFEDSAFGKASLARLEADARNLQVEIRKVEADLEIEERLLTERRAGLSPAEFQPMAREFDDKVEKIRAAWEQKDRDLKREREQDQKTFFDSAVPILAAMMQEAGAVLLVDQSTVILSLDRVDITNVAIERVNSALASPAAPTTAPDTPAPETPAPEASAPETAAPKP